MRIMGIDPGNKTAIVGLTDNKVDSINTVRLLPATKKKEKIPLSFRLKDYLDQIMLVIAKYQPDRVVIEEPYIPHRTAAKSMDMKLALIMVACEIVGVAEVKLINPSTAAKSGGLRTSGFSKLRESGNTQPLSDVNQKATIIQGDFFALSREFR